MILLVSLSLIPSRAVSVLLCVDSSGIWWGERENKQKKGGGGGGRALDRPCTAALTTSCVSGHDSREYPQSQRQHTHTMPLAQSPEVNSKSVEARFLLFSFHFVQRYKMRENSQPTRTLLPLPAPASVTAAEGILAFNQQWRRRISFCYHCHCH